jgi:hypothetical protein
MPSLVKCVSVHGSRVTSVQRDIEPQTGRGLCFAVEWPMAAATGRRGRPSRGEFRHRFQAKPAPQFRRGGQAHGASSGRHALFAHGPGWNKTAADYAILRGHHRSLLEKTIPPMIGDGR